MTQTAHGLTSHTVDVPGRRAAETARRGAPLVQASPAVATAAPGAAAGDPAAWELAPWERAPAEHGGFGAIVDSEHLSAVWRTSSYLESIQWELDAAHESLRQAVQHAASSGVDHRALLQAANMTSEELEEALLDAPSA